MKINPRFYPVILIVIFTVFMLIGFLLGFRPQHGGGRGHDGFIPLVQYVLASAVSPA